MHEETIQCISYVNVKGTASKTGERQLGISPLSSFRDPSALDPTKLMTKFQATKTETNLTLSNRVGKVVNQRPPIAWKKLHLSTEADPQNMKTHAY